MDKSFLLKIVSFNIKCLMYDEQREGICSVIKLLNGDIVGLQEVDSFTNRSNNYSQIEYIAKKCGYNYFDFNPSIKYMGGHYGHGILSKYPIKECHNIYYKTKAINDHNRNYSQHKIEINGKELYFYNTHLTLGNEDENGAELKEVTENMSEHQFAVLTGDMNMEPTNMYKFADSSKIKILNYGNGHNFLRTFPQGNKSEVGIDNIMITKNIAAITEEQKSDFINLYRTEYSDHNPIFTYIKL